MIHRSAFPYLVLAAGVFIMSASSILIRFAQQAEMPSLTIAAGRLALAALILTPIAWGRAGAELLTLRRHDLLLGIGAGVFLALHFGAWISSLAYTSVASSAALVSTTPLWVGLAALVLLREPMRLGGGAGILLTFGGSVCIIASDAGRQTTGDGANPLIGNGLALIGAMAVAGYFLIGRALQRRLSLLAYIWLSYTSAAVVLCTVTAISGQRVLGFPPPIYLILLGLAVGPQLLGHTAFNWSLRHLSATFVAISILGEPIGSALLAVIIFGEWFAPLQLVGFVLLLIGIYVAATSEQCAVREALPTSSGNQPAES